ncbi:MAG: antibiotic biosynthesis monooxygenase family protein [Candidatus Dormibacteraceae bacterium]
MFSVLFEVNPKRDEWDAYLGYARLLRPELERIEGFVDNIRYRSLTREGWLLSLSSWDDEKSLVRWRTLARHHEVQVKGRTEVFADYHLRVGQLTEDTRLPAGRVLAEQRLDETEAGAGTAVTLVDSARPEEWVTANAPERLAAWLGLPRAAAGLLTWDVFDAVLSPGQIVLLVAWRDRESALAFGGAAPLPEGARRRQVRVIRDYGMYDRREAPQYYPDIPRA